MEKKRIYPPTYLLISLLVMLILHLFIPGMTIIPPFWNLLGILPLASGLVLSIIAEQAFHKACTTVTPFAESTSLVTGGVYRFTRNPMYLGFTLVLGGVAILLGSLTPFLVIIAFAFLIERIFIIVEERMLADKFGEEWWQFARQTRRWV